MENDHFQNRAKPLIINGVKTGASLGFFGSLLYTLMLFLLFFSNAVFAPPSPHYDSVISGSILISMMIGLITIPPSIIIGMVGGSFVALILAISRTRIKDGWACLVGFVLGTIVILIVNYWIWQKFYTDLHEPVPFSKYLFPTKIDFSFGVLIDPNPFFIPSLIAILLSAWGAWRINRQSSVKQNIDNEEDRSNIEHPQID